MIGVPAIAADIAEAEILILPKGRSATRAPWGSPAGGQCLAWNSHGVVAPWDLSPFGDKQPGGMRWIPAKRWA